MRGVVLCAALAMGLLPTRAGAQSVQLTESEALARLSPDNPRVRALRAGIEVTRADVLAAGRWPNPRVTIDRESVAGATEYLSMVSQPLPTSGRRRFDVQAASARVDATTARADADVRRLRADVRLAFSALLAAQVREAQLRAVVERVTSVADTLARREAAGDTAGYDRLRAEREVMDLDADLMLAVTDRQRAQAELASLIGGPPDAPLVAVPSQGPAAPLPPVAALLERAEATRGDVIALQHDAAAADLAAQSAARQRVPEPEVVAGTKSSTVGTGDIGTVFMVHATLPLFDRARPERALAAARAAQARTQAEALRQTLRGQIEALRASVAGRRDAAARYGSRALQASSDIERIAQVSYDAGERGILELLDAWRLAATARVRQAAMELAVRQAEIELELATGWELQ